VDPDPGGPKTCGLIYSPSIGKGKISLGSRMFNQDNKQLFKIVSFCLPGMKPKLNIIEMIQALCDELHTSKAVLWILIRRN
jgi:hypothetical protein